MNIKYCYKDEIHKTFYPPVTFTALLNDIKSIFGNKLPHDFSLQYKDNDGDLVTISSDIEYRSMLRFDASRLMSSFKIFIVPSQKTIEDDKKPEGSFEVIED